MRISSAERKIMLAAGACAGMSVIFGSPLAAILLAIYPQTTFCRLIVIIIGRMIIIMFQYQ